MAATALSSMAARPGAVQLLAGDSGYPQPLAGPVRTAHTAGLPRRT